jgi:hypothetical protein
MVSIRLRLRLTHSDSERPSRSTSPGSTTHKWHLELKPLLWVAKGSWTRSLLTINFPLLLITCVSVICLAYLWVGAEKKKKKRIKHRRLMVRSHDEKDNANSKYERERERDPTLTKQIWCCSPEANSHLPFRNRRWGEEWLGHPAN